MTDTSGMARAREQLVIHVGLQLAMAGVHAIVVAWMLLSAADVLPWIDVPDASLWPLGIWAVVGAVWAPINARGLWRRRPWARRSALYYWLTALPLCCCIPLPGWAVWSLTRPAMRDLLDRDSSA
jgi:hypothetical protein